MCWAGLVGVGMGLNWFYIYRPYQGFTMTSMCILAQYTLPESIFWLTRRKFKPCVVKCFFFPLRVVNFPPIGLSFFSFCVIVHDHGFSSWREMFLSSSSWPFQILQLSKESKDVFVTPNPIINLVNFSSIGDIKIVWPILLSVSDNTSNHWAVPPHMCTCF